MPNNPKSNEELAKAVQAGDAELVEVLWNQVEGLVKWKAERLMSALETQGNVRGLEFDDLLQTGFVAMMDAVQTFKPECGSFSTWFTYHIQNAFAAASGYKTKRSRSDPLNSAVSLDLPLSEDPDGGSLADLVPDSSATDSLEAVDDEIWHEQLHKTLEQLMGELPEKSNLVLRLRYYDNQSLAAVGDAFGVGPEMARQLERQALRELRKPCNARKLRPFLDFNPYSGTGLGAFRATGQSVQERYLIREENARAKTGATAPHQNSK